MLEPLANGSGYVAIRSAVCILPIATNKKGVKEQAKHKDTDKKHDMVSVVFSTTGVPLRTVLSKKHKGNTYVQAETSVFAFDLSWWHAGPADSVPEGTDFTQGKQYIAPTRFMATFVRCDIPKQRMDEMLLNDGGVSDMPLVFALA
jgi:hypothetical protein